jgi:hypothetical protein
MFRATFIGHHCWLFQGERGRLLVDPLLLPRWGFTDSVELRAWPPRRFDMARFPAIDAVMITHEHEGHFEIPSLAVIDRRVPIYLSERSSLATRQFIGEMGFEVRLMSPERPIAVGDLELLPMTADQVRARADEWDVAPFLVRDTGGDGSFFSQVDMRVNDSMWQIAKGKLKRPGLWSYTNNHNQWDFLYAWRYPPPRNLYRLVSDVFAYHQTMCDEWAAPAAVLIAGGGFTFGGDQAWLNEAVFPLPSSEVAEALAALDPNQKVLAPIPGHTLIMRGGELVEVEPQSEFVAAAPRAEWPERRGEPPAWLEEYGPATGRTDLDDAEAEALSAELDRFAGHLYGSALFRRLYSLSMADAKGRKPTVALTLRVGNDGGAFVYEYEPQGCRFKPVAVEDPVAQYVAVYECWATDLLALLRGEIASTSLLFARCRHWNASPELLGFDFDLYLIEYAHPLRQPQRFLALYRRILASLPDTPVKIARRAE